MNADAALMDAVNVARRAGRPAIDLERQAEARFGAARRLAVYGNLAPGEVHHHLVAGLRGPWREAVVHGDLRTVGWAAGLGFPALRARADGYRRILVPIHDAAGKMTIVNLYQDSDV